MSAQAGTTDTHCGCGRPLNMRRQCSTHGWQAKPWDPADCPHCGASGQLRTHTSACVHQMPYACGRCTCSPGKPHPCNFCGGTGRTPLHALARR